MQLEDRPIESLSGVGKTRLGQLKKLGIDTVSDLIYHFPRAYENRGDVSQLSSVFDSEVHSFVLTVATEPRSNRLPSGISLTKFRAFDDSGRCEIAFFNSPYVKNVFHVGECYRFYGKLIRRKSTVTLQNPKYEPYVEGAAMQDLVPVYPLTEGLSSKMHATLVKTALDTSAAQIVDHLPKNIRLSKALPTLSYALKNVHFPESNAALAASLKRLAFDELLLFGLGISLSTKTKSDAVGIQFKKASPKPLLDLLPYELTEGQKNAVNDVYKDTVYEKDGFVRPMARIIVGDVGSGKTVVAEFALYFCVNSGYQAALMVPTEILARQHYASIKEHFDRLGYKTELLLGSHTQKEKNRIHEALRQGEVDIVIGTHSIISEKVEFKNLGLVITDEQHRFGVNQRALLKEKSRMAHVLVMSATPIPRTLALTMYGDLDVSRITEMPKGRSRVDTFVVNEAYRARLNEFIRKQVALGGQCYIVCPAIEGDSEGERLIPDSISVSEMVSVKALNLKNATEYAAKLQEQIPEITVGCLHGKMKTAEKDKIMKDFADGKIQALVSTTVIEVGVNVPNASLMVVENAERFGLSQLHQLRGRVGRGSRKSYCVLVSDINAEVSRARLEVMRTTYNGFEIAEKDLLLRGPGDFFSSNNGDNLRQSGGFEFKISSMCNDAQLLQDAFETAKSIVNLDPELERPENYYLKRELSKFKLYNSSTIS